MQLAELKLKELAVEGVITVNEIILHIQALGNSQSAFGKVGFLGGTCISGVMILSKLMPFGV